MVALRSPLLLAVLALLCSSCAEASSSNGQSRQRRAFFSKKSMQFEDRSNHLGDVSGQLGLSEPSESSTVCLLEKCLTNLELCIGLKNQGLQQQHQRVPRDGSRCLARYQECSVSCSKNPGEVGGGGQ
ncbi:uncharacterized protein LOC144949376 [Lampetra fluviatilis]